MIKKLFKLTSEQYKKLYSGEVVSSSSGLNSLQLNLENFTLTVNNSLNLLRTEYYIEVSDKYLDMSIIDNMLNFDIIEILKNSVVEKLTTAADNKMIITADDFEIMFLEE